MRAKDGTFHRSRGDALAIELQTECPSCETFSLIDASLLGKKVGCPTCRRSFYANRARPAAAGDNLSAVLTQPSKTSPASSSTENRPEGARRPSFSSEPRTDSSTRLGRYQLRRVIGEGAFGTVWLCSDTHTSRSVAVKLMHFEARDQKRAARFLTEARAAAALRHPNIVAVLNAGRVEGQHFIATEYVQGPTLEEFAVTKSPTQCEAADCIRKLALALDYAHRHDIVHRDVKPLNIIIDTKSEPQLLDFGLAKRLDFDSALTVDGSVLGTPAYMPPEQARGDLAAIGPATDQYSLAACLYFLLTGQSPFVGNAAAVLQMAIHSAPTPILQLNPQADVNLVAICQRAMAYEPAKRYSTCGDFAHDLQLFLAGLPVRARPISVRERITRWCHRHPAEAKFSAAVAMVLITGVLISSIGWLSARRAMNEATRREKDAAILVQQRQQVQLDLQQRLSEIEAATRQAQAAKTMAEKQRAAFDIESVKLKQAIEQTQRNTALVIETTESLKAEEAKIAELHQEIAGTASTVSETKQTLVEMRLQSEADKLLKERLRRVRQSIESENFDEAKQSLQDIPESLHGWETHVLTALVESQQRAIQVRSIDLSRFGSGFETPEWQWAETDSPDKFLLFRSGSKTATKLLIIDLATATASDIGVIGSVHNVCFSEQHNSISFGAGVQTPHWSTVVNKEPFETLLYSVAAPTQSIWQLHQTIVHPRHGAVYAIAAASQAKWYSRSSKPQLYRSAARLQRLRRSEEKHRLVEQLIERHAAEWFEPYRLIRMNGDPTGVIWDRQKDTYVNAALKRYLNERAQKWFSAEVELIRAPAMGDVYSESGTHHVAIMANYQIGLRPPPRPGLPIKRPTREIMTVMVPISSMDANKILPTQVYVTSNQWWAVNGGAIDRRTVRATASPTTPENLRTTWMIPAEISEPWDEDVLQSSTRNRVGNSVLVRDSATISSLRGPLLWRSEVAVDPAPPQFRWITCYADAGQLMFGEIGQDNFHAVASLQHVQNPQSMQLTAEARYLFRKNPTSIEFIDLHDVVPGTMSDLVDKPNAEVAP
ncbi:Serine/threonine protein kinase domain protein [Rhodopirellula maiorica SM1]|uniref:Serine/threonine protein kinase domain protein n=1 Tax=Rhodopirellula maiorica SM1 TaxID=1265738 RepID=M5RJX2_9BACT|nr:serine/threonine-protein kinase [Rhodopirellula maiorica]EMI19491.1 Serine/threonine protein kinase domain protein [Rhodopirellula maiorica SM1]